MDKKELEEKRKELEAQEAEQKEQKELTQKEKEAWINFLKVRRANLLRLVASRRVKSVNRAIKRNRVTPQGELGAGRPFNNRANTSNRKGIHSRVYNEYKKRLYEQFKRVAKKQSVQ